MTAPGPAARERAPGGPSGSEELDLPPWLGTFLRGLSLGALVGAAIAGSALLRWRQARGAGAGPGPGPRSGR